MGRVLVHGEKGSELVFGDQADRVGGHVRLPTKRTRSRPLLIARDCFLVKRIRAQFTALRYFALDGTGPPQLQGTGQPVHHLAKNHADDERLRQIVTGQTLPDAALARVQNGTARNTVRCTAEFRAARAAGRRQRPASASEGPAWRASAQAAIDHCPSGSDTRTCR
jgi:hypothetical protein